VCAWVVEWVDVSVGFHEKYRKSQQKKIFLSTYLWSRFQNMDLYIYMYQKKDVDLYKDFKNIYRYFKKVNSTGTLKKLIQKTCKIGSFAIFKSKCRIS
jgi:hypothetical protein